MDKFRNEVYALVDEEYMSNFNGQQMEYMRNYYYKEYCGYCHMINRKPLPIDVFFSNMHRRRIQLYQVCCPYCGFILLIIHDKKIQGKAGYNYCPHCGRASAVENIFRQTSRFVRIQGINKLGLKEFKRTHNDTEEWLLSYDCLQVELISLVSIIEVLFRDYFDALLFVNNYCSNNSYVKKVIQRQTGNDFMNIEKANKDFKKAFDIDIKNSIDKSVWIHFIDVDELRNMIIHNNGRVDEHFKSTSTYARNKSKVIGELYRLEEKDISEYFQSVILGVSQISNLFLKNNQMMKIVKLLI